MLKLRLILSGVALLVATVTQSSAAGIGSNSVVLPPTIYPNGGTMPRYDLFLLLTPGPLLPLCNVTSWDWSTITDIAQFLPDPALGSCASQTQYFEGFRISGALTAETNSTAPDKPPTWFLTNHPDWISYRAPMRLSATLTSGSPTAVAPSIDASLPLSSYGLSGAPFPLGTTITAISTTGLTASANTLDTCVSCSASFQITMAGYGDVTVTGTVAAGTNTVTGMVLANTNGINASSNVATLGIGSFVTTAAAFPTGTMLQTWSGGAGSMTFSNNALTGSGTTVPFTVMTMATVGGGTTCGSGPDCLDTSLDIANPVVRYFLIYGCRTAVGGGTGNCSYVGAILSGYAGIDIDNGNSYISVGQWGHYAGVTIPCASSNWPACNGTAVQQYTALGYGISDYGDLAYQNDRLTFTQAVVAAIHQYGGFVVQNMGIGFSPANDTVDVAGTAAIANMNDIHAYEGAASGGCGAGGLWRPNNGNVWVNGHNTLVAESVPIAPTDDEPCYTTATVPQGDEEMYDVANALLVAKSDCGKSACFWYNVRASADSGKLVVFDPSFFPNLGPISSAVPPHIGTTGVINATDTAYERIYQKGFVYFNPSTTATASGTIPAICAPCVDIFGNNWSAGALTLNPSPIPAAIPTSISGSGVTLTFASGVIPTSVVTGMKAVDQTTPASLASTCRTNVIGSTTITLTGAGCSAAAVASGDTIGLSATGNALVLIAP